MIAHALSLSRLATAPVFAWALLDLGRAPLAAGLLALAVASDLLDGPVARARGTASDLGRLLDHGSDFAFVECGLLALAWTGALPLALPVLVGLAFAEYAIDSYGVGRARALRPNPLGRWNGVLYFVLPGCVIAARLGAPLPAPAIGLFAWVLTLSTAVSIASRLWALRGVSRSSG
ncbi:MAG: CDP-alcohol phosphatidyltransferase family protein [Myxococcota bacterium]